MKYVALHQMSDHSRLRVCLGTALLLVALASLLALPAAAQPPGDTFSSGPSSANPSSNRTLLKGRVEHSENCHACCGAEKWFLAHNSAWQQNAHNCLGLLRQAYDLEAQGLAAFQAHDAQNGNRLMAARTKLLNSFKNCAIQANRAQALKAGRKRTVELSGATGGTPDPLLQKADKTLEGVAVRVEDTILPPMRALDKLLADISDYDMTRQHEGLKLLQDILADMTLGHLIEAAPGALRKMTGKSLDGLEGAASKTAQNAPPKSLDNTPHNNPGQNRSWGNQADAPSGPLGNSANDLEGILKSNWSPEHTSWANPPAGVKLPEVVKNTPRPVAVQEQPYSCAIACVKMVSETVKRASLPESWLRSLSHGDVKRWSRKSGGYHPGRGTFPADIKPVLDLAKVPNSGIRRASIYDLARATRQGYPAIAGVNRAGGGHAIVVDAVVGSPGNRFVVVRDPLNLAHMTVRDRQFLRLAGFSNHTIIPESVFSKTFQGQAIFTHP